MASRPWSEGEIKRILTSVVAWSGDVKAALEHLKTEEKVKRIPTAWTVIDWMKWEHRDLYGSLREANTETMERDLADRYRGVAMQAVEATGLGVQEARILLESGKDPDPSRSAANLAVVADKTLRNYSLLEGKPTEIREDRTLPDVMRALIDMGVLVPHAQPEIEAADVESTDEP